MPATYSLDPEEREKNASPKPFGWTNASGWTRLAAHLFAGSAAAEPGERLRASQPGAMPGGEMAYRTDNHFGETEQPIDQQLVIPPGRYTIEAEDIHGRTATTIVEVSKAGTVIEVKVPAR